jgi:inorganic pyrophosphatase
MTDFAIFLTSPREEKLCMLESDGIINLMDSGDFENLIINDDEEENEEIKDIKDIESSLKEAEKDIQQRSAFQNSAAAAAVSM